MDKGTLSWKVGGPTLSVEAERRYESLSPEGTVHDDNLRGADRLLRASQDEEEE
jgi:hypothetical protein